MRLRPDPMELRYRLRRREIERTFDGVPSLAFTRGLELGAGDGRQSQILTRWCASLVATDLNARRLAGGDHPKVVYQVADAQALPWVNGEFDLVYSSNLLEHLPQPVDALRSMSSALADDGVMVHVIPNRFWKALHLGLFYPNKSVNILERATGSRRAALSERGNNLSTEKPGRRRSWTRHLAPPPHGVSHNHLAEFVRFGRGPWLKTFSEAGYDVVATIGGLPAHSPYRFGWEVPRRLAEALGFSSTTGFVLKKRGKDAPIAGYFRQGR